jgi:hypothetical protein
MAKSFSYKGETGYLVGFGMVEDGETMVLEDDGMIEFAETNASFTATGAPAPAPAPAPPAEPTKAEEVS